MCNVKYTVILLCVAFTANTAYACTPGSEGVLDTLLAQLGIAPLTGPIGADATSATGEYITDPNTQLSCNFEDISSCRWMNMAEGTNAAIDTVDYFLFEVEQVASGFPLLSPTGRQPPANSKVLFAGSQTATPGAIWMSDPIACQPAEGTLSFEYWLFGSAQIRVVLLDPVSHDKIWQAPSTCVAGPIFPALDGYCRTTIPAQTAPFKIGIQAINLPNSFAIVDNIAYNTAPLGAACDGSLDFGTTSSAMISGLTGTAVTDGSELLCTDPAVSACKWGNDGIEPEFMVHTGTVDANKWYAATGTSVVPTGEFLMVQGLPGQGPAVLKSELIECTSGTGTVNLKAWMSSGVIMKVCLKDSATNAVIVCQTLNRFSGPSYTVTLTAPSEVQNAVLEISAENWGTGAIAAVDDISYDFGSCDSSAILIGNANTELIPYTGAPIGVIATDAELACTVDAPDACRWGDPDPSHQWYWVNNVDATKLQTFTGTSTVPTSGAAYYEFSGPNEYTFFGSDELFCVRNGGNLQFNAWATTGVEVEVCAVMYAEAREVCKPAQTITSPGPVAVNFATSELSTTSPVVFVITAYSATTPAFIMIDNLEFTGSVCPDPTLASGDETLCGSLSTSFDSLTSMPPGWKNCVGCAGGVATVPWVPTDQVLGHHNIRVRGPTGSIKPHMSSSLMVLEDPTGADIAPGISIMESVGLSFSEPHWMSFTYQRGTFGSQLYVCKNAVPALVRRDIPLFHPDCEKIAGPNMYADEWIDGGVGGFLIEPAMTKVYFVFTAPWKYSYGQAHILLDDIIIHEGSTAETPPLCLPTS